LLSVADSIIQIGGIWQICIENTKTDELSCPIRLTNSNYKSIFYAPVSLSPFAITLLIQHHVSIMTAK